jgi:chorismate mutase
VLALGSVSVLPRAGATEPNPLSALVGAAVERLLTADPVAAYKWQSKGSIEDPVRVDQVLAAVRADALAEHLDPGAAPTTAADLSSSRTQIDALNHTMVTEIANQWGLLHSPACAAARDDAVDDESRARQLDSLYRQALEFATRSYCQPPD